MGHLLVIVEYLICVGRRYVLVKVEIRLCALSSSSLALKVMESELSYKNRCFFSLVGNYLRPSNILDS